MSNMSYCRHENTASDLADVVESWNDFVAEDATREELAARIRIMKMAMQLVEGLNEAIEESGQSRFSISDKELASVYIDGLD